MYSIRLNVKTVDALKRKAAVAGIPYQTYMNVVYCGFGLKMGQKNTSKHKPVTIGDADQK